VLAILPALFTMALLERGRRINKADTGMNGRPNDGPPTVASLLGDRDVNGGRDGGGRRVRRTLAESSTVSRFRRRFGFDTGYQLLGDKPLTSYRLPQELAQARPELDHRREKYFTDVDGEKRINLEHGDIAAVKRYGNEVLDGPLRVRAHKRNAQSPKLLAMADMDLPDLVAFTQEHQPLRKKKDSQEYLLPQDYVKATAGVDQWGEALFYHDAPVLVEGVLASDIPDKLKLAKGIVGDLVFQLYLFDGMIPNGSSRKLDGRSNPPSLTRMGLRIYKEMLETGENPEEAKRWLGAVMDAAEIEFFGYWKNRKDYHHTVENIEDLELITPGALDVGSHDMAMRETGHDTDPAHMDRAHDFLEPKLNGELIRYAWDISRYKSLIGDEDAASTWEAIGNKMAEQMPVMYDGEIYRLLDVRTAIGDFSEVASLAGFMPMANVVLPEKHVETMVAHLDEFTGPYGIAHDVPDTVPLTPTKKMLRPFSRGMRPTIRNLYRKHQWGGSNEAGKQDGITEWPVDTHGLIKGLQRYGYVDKAIEVAEQWLLGYTEYFTANGTLPEKRNVITGVNGHGVEYPQQTDFGWSISNYLWVLKELPELYAKRSELKAKGSDGAEASTTINAEPITVVTKFDLARHKELVEFPS
jgi:neutral trehalase